MPYNTAADSFHTKKLSLSLRNWALRQASADPKCCLSLQHTGKHNVDKYYDFITSNT